MNEHPHFLEKEGNSLEKNLDTILTNEYSSKCSSLYCAYLQSHSSFQIIYSSYNLCLPQWICKNTSDLCYFGNNFIQNNKNYYAMEISKFPKGIVRLYLLITRRYIQYMNKFMKFKSEGQSVLNYVSLNSSQF